MLVQIKLRHTLGKPCEKLSLVIGYVGKNKGILDIDKVYDEVKTYLHIEDISHIWFIVTEVGIEPISGPINHLKSNDEEE